MYPTRHPQEVILRSVSLRTTSQKTLTSTSEMRREKDEHPKRPTKKWSLTTCLTKKHRCQTLDKPSTTVQREWARSSKESHVKDDLRKLVRPLTWREIARIQGFEPEWFEIEDRPLSDGEKISAIGNAVPPPFARAVHRGLFKTVPEDEWEHRTCLEVCAGVGGLALGAQELVGFEHLALVDFWEVATRVLEARGRDRGFWNPEAVYTADARSFDFSPYVGRVGILSGGPPCQPFSSGSKRMLGGDDERDVLCEFPDIMAAVRPEFVIIENVSGLLAPRNAEYLRTLVQRLSQPSEDSSTYGVAYRLFDVSKYGVPQVRKRIVFVCARDRDVAFAESVLDAVERETDPQPRFRTVGDVIRAEGKDEDDASWLSWPFDDLY